MTDIDDMLEAVWREEVASKYVYRGMGQGSITDPINPANNPYAAALPLVKTCLELLQRVVDSGFEFTLVETHWGQSWRHDLKNIVAWSRNDLAHPRVDFTSSYQTAREYSDNWQGSQLKQNLKYIAEHLPEHRDDRLLGAVLGEDDWAILDQVEQWLRPGQGEHVGVVLWLRRSHPALRSKHACAPVGSFTDFCRRVRGELDRQRLPHDRISVASLLPQEFDAYLAGPLQRRDIERIDEVT